MLPDFLNIKRELSLIRYESISSNLFGDPVLSKIRTYRQHEGNRFTIFREDGTQSTSDQREIRSELVTFDLKDIQARGERAIFESLAPARQQVATAGRRLFSERLKEEPIPATHAKGRPFTAELYLEMLETVVLEFDEEGNRKDLDFWQEHPNPQLLARVESEKKRFESEPDLQEKLDALIARKRQEWNDREANRKLVD